MRKKDGIFSFSPFFDFRKSKEMKQTICWIYITFHSHIFVFKYTWSQQNTQHCNSLPLNWTSWTLYLAMYFNPKSIRNINKTYPMYLTYQQALHAQIVLVVVYLLLMTCLSHTQTDRRHHPPVKITIAVNQYFQWCNIYDLFYCFVYLF